MNEYHGCRTGDCPHEKQSECDEALRVENQMTGDEELRRAVFAGTINDPEVAKQIEDRMNEFKDGLRSGKVTLMMSEDSADVLVDDGTARLVLIRNAYMGPDVFGFAAQDENGFTGIYCDKLGWEVMKAKIDAFDDHDCYRIVKARGYEHLEGTIFWPATAGLTEWQGDLCTS